MIKIEKKKIISQAKYRVEGAQSVWNVKEMTEPKAFFLVTWLIHDQRCLLQSPKLTGQPHDVMRIWRDLSQVAGLAIVKKTTWNHGTWTDGSTHRRKHEDKRRVSRLQSHVTLAENTYRPAGSRKRFWQRGEPLRGAIQLFKFSLALFFV